MSIADVPTPWRRNGAAALAIFTSGCVVSFDGYEPLESTGSSDGGSSSGSVSATVGGASTSSQTSASGSPGGGGAGAEGGSGASGNAGGGGSGTGGTPGQCPTQGGPMVALQAPGGDYCVDRTEVTQDRYQAFLAGGPDLGSQIAACTGNSSFDPSCSFTPVTTPNRPVVCVDWCDAYAFCAFVGKRLCGKIGGGASTSAGADDPAVSQWYRACSKAGASVYPYSNLYEADTCNGADAPFTSTVDVAYLSQCQGGYTDLWDMSGNAREWEDACEGSNCLQRGGSWLDWDTSSPHSLRCDSDGMGARTQANNEIGFRCCADL